MPMCPQCSDFLKPQATSCPECGWGEPPRARALTPDARPTWSPSPPPFQEESWRAGPRMTPEEVAPYLAALKATVQRSSSAPVVNTAQTERYLKACQARKRRP
jgi:hypothetical protein